jgi:membrane-associated phospholipid phosphatase
MDTLTSTQRVPESIVTTSCCPRNSRRRLIAVAEDGYSFPSGHATGIMVVVLLSAWMLTRWVIRSWNRYVLVWTATALLAGVAGASGWQPPASPRPGPEQR